MSAEHSTDRWLARLRWWLIVNNILLAALFAWCISIHAEFHERDFSRLNILDKLPTLTNTILSVPAWLRLAIGIGILASTLVKEAMFRSPRSSINVNAVQSGVMVFLVAYYLVVIRIPYLMISCDLGD